MKTTDIGNRGEEFASNFLRSQGYKILERNWKTRWCEIDIVAQKANCVYFIEVKYRHNDDYGDGLEYITTKKLQQMTFAAELWLTAHKWNGDSQILAASVNGVNDQVNLVEIV